jgi:endonuclease G
MDQDSSISHALDQLALSYNRETESANWVSWHLDSTWVRGEGRSNDFRADTQLPVPLQVKPRDYVGTGFDKGHLCPSGDRTDSSEDNSATFVMSNMVPQAPRNNRQ